MPDLSEQGRAMCFAVCNPLMVSMWMVKEVQILKNPGQKNAAGGIEIGAEEKPPKEEYSTSDILVQDNRIVDNIEKWYYGWWISEESRMGKKCSDFEQPMQNNGKTMPS